MKNLERLNKEELHDLLHHIVEASRILNIDELSLSDMNPESDMAMIQLSLMQIQVFNAIKVYKEDRQRHLLAKHRIKNALMNDMSSDEADELIDKTIEHIKKADTMQDVEDIWSAFFGIEMDDLNDLMGW